MHESHAALIRRSAGRDLHFIGCGISPHAQRESFRVTLASIGDAVITTDPEAKATFLNAVGEVLTGWTFAEAEGQPVANVFHIIHEDPREPVPSPIAKVLHEGIAVALAVGFARRGRFWLAFRQCSGHIWRYA